MTTCALAECDKPLKRGGYCYGHYMKNWRYGTPTPQHPRRYEDITGQRYGTLVALTYDDNWWHCLCDCGATRRVRIAELKRTGDGNTCGLEGRHLGIDISYSTAHQRVRHYRGRVNQYDCIDCGRPAQQWSYDHADPDELIGHTPRTEGIAYSADPDHYQPRCVSCHKLFDLDHINSVHGIRRRRESQGPWTPVRT